mmetsp:Transcript_34565/g.99275  ORF Transcript_34565/g.99275 Transcript_34565/m.99275 type:complete len:209 (+) Transcript_34565:436-1062(+)
MLHSWSTNLHSFFTWPVLPQHLQTISGLACSLAFPLPLPVPFAGASACLQTALRCPVLPHSLHSLSVNLQSFLTWPTLPQQRHGTVETVGTSASHAPPPSALRHIAFKCPILPQMPHSRSQNLHSVFSWPVFPQHLHQVSSVQVSACLQTAFKWPTLPHKLHSLSKNLHSFFLWPDLPQHKHVSAITGPSKCGPAGHTLTSQHATLRA